MIPKKLYDKYATDPAAFRDSLTVDVSGTARRFGDVQDPWQRADFASIDPALKRCAGRSIEPARKFAYLERPRGHSKTTDIAVTCVWALTFATRPIRAYAFAADKDQATLLKDAIATIIRLNPWLADVLDVGSKSVSNGAPGHPGAGATLSIEASDVGSSYGILPDLIVADELTHWEDNAEGLFESISSSSEKRTHCMLVVISNAGFIDSWQWRIREAARTAEEDWIFSRLDGVQASWFNAKTFERQRKMLPPIAFSRLWENQWSTGGGDALTAAVINAAFEGNHQRHRSAQAGWEYVGGLDLGVVRDASALVILGVKRTHTGHGRIRLAHTQIWRPTKDKKVQLAEVEKAIVEAHVRFKLQRLNADPTQAMQMIQQLQAGGVGVYASDLHKHATSARVPIEELPQTGGTLHKMATTLIEAFNDYRVELYDDVDLRRDLFSFRIEEMSYGFRLKSPRDQHGHGDMGSAFAMAMLAASDLAGLPKQAAGVVSLDSGTTRVGRTLLERAYEAFDNGNGDRLNECMAVAEAFARRNG